MKTVEIFSKNTRLTLTITTPKNDSTVTKEYRSLPQPSGMERECCDLCDLRGEWVCGEVPCSPKDPPLSKNGYRLFKLIKG